MCMIVCVHVSVRLLQQPTCLLLDNIARQACSRTPQDPIDGGSLAWQGAQEVPSPGTLRRRRAAAEQPDCPPAMPGVAGTSHDEAAAAVFSLEPTASLSWSPGPLATRAVPAVRAAAPGSAASTGGATPPAATASVATVAQHALGPAAATEPAQVPPAPPPAAADQPALPESAPQNKRMPRPLPEQAAALLQDTWFDQEAQKAKQRQAHPAVRFRRIADLDNESKCDSRTAALCLPRLPFFPIIAPGDRMFGSSMSRQRAYLRTTRSSGGGLLGSF